MSKNIVVLSGSPRKGGNTDLLTEAFIKGAKESGNTVKQFRVADMKIGGCLGCQHCFEHGGACVQKDDMPQILNALKTADVVVYASPIYYAGVTAQLKATIDRTYALMKVGSPWTKCALLLTCGNPDVSMAEPTIAMYKAILGFGNRENCGIIVAAGINGIGEIAGKPELAKAEELGRNI